MEFEIEHAYELTVYRVFGLSLVAGIIDSIQTYISFREETLKNKTLDQKLQIIQNKVLEKVHAAMACGKEGNHNHGVMKALQQQITMVSTIIEDEEFSLSR